MTVSINITDDNDDEGDEAFGLVLKRTDSTRNRVEIIGPTTAFGIIEDNDEPGRHVATHVRMHALMYMTMLDTQLQWLNLIFFYLHHRDTIST